MEEKIENKKEEPKKNEYRAVEVPTQYVPAFENPEGKIMSTEQLLVEIANKLTRVEEAVA